MSTALKISYDEFEAMIVRGDFAEDDPNRYELINGEIVTMPPPDPIHDELIDRFARWSFLTLPEERVRVRVQGSMGLPELDSVPFPAISWLRPVDYSSRRPGPADVFLVVEVANFSLWNDRNIKGQLYAGAGVADYWIANVRGQSVEVLRDPGPDGYASKTVYYPGDLIRPLALPDVAFPISLLFPAGRPGPAVEPRANGVNP